MRLNPKTDKEKYEEMDSLNRMLCLLKNPIMHENVLRGTPFIEDSLEAKVVILSIEDRMQQIIDEDTFGVFSSFINTIGE